MPTSGRYFLAYPPLLLASWVVAWIVNVALRSRFEWDSHIDTIYWIAMKSVFWILPVLLAIRVFENANPAQFLELRRPMKGALWALGIGIALVVVTFLGRTMPTGSAGRVPSWDLALLNAAVVAPIVEEVTVRGFVMRRLELNHRSFWTANVLATMFFVAMHLPGWLFQGRVTSVAGVVGSTLPLAGLSLLFGWAKRRSGSLYGAIGVHAINNLYSTMFP